MEEIIWDDSVIVSADASPLDFLTKVYRDASQPMVRRVKCAIAAANFVHPRLAVVANVTEGNLGSLLDRARARSAGLVEARRTGRVVDYVRSGEALPQVIEGEAQPVPVEEVSGFQRRA